VLRLPKGGFEASAGPSQSDPPPGSLGREELVAWLEQEEGNVARVSRRTGIERTALYRLMERYGIERKGRGGT
jgi:transcriptional regulator of acetoin/glycerol metabolism